MAVSSNQRCWSSRTLEPVIDLVYRILAIHRKYASDRIGLETRPGFKMQPPGATLNLIELFNSN